MRTGSGGERRADERRQRPRRADDRAVRQRGDGQRERAGRHVRLLRARPPARRERVRGARRGSPEVDDYVRGDDAALIHPLRRHGPLRSSQLFVSDSASFNTVQHCTYKVGTYTDTNSSILSYLLRVL